jgi:hypothetical protein
MSVRFAVRAAKVTKLIGLLAVGAATARAQVGTLRTVVMDSLGLPISGAEVTISTLARMARTDTAGRTQIGSLPTGTFEILVRQFGYQAKRVNVTVRGGGYDTVRVMLVEQTTTLDEVDVSTTALHPYAAGFEQRRARGIGTFITRDQIDARHTTTTSDLFRSLPSVVLIRVSAGLGIRFPANFTSLRRGGQDVCMPMIWVDGQRAPGMEIDELIATDIQAIELYRGVATTPAQFATGGAVPCGAVVVWTRRKG